MTQVTFVGLGDIGSPMAARLAAQFPLTVWNRTALRAAKFATAHRATVAPAASDAVRGSDIIASCLSTSADVDAVVTAALPGLQRGQTWIDFTSGDPASSRQIAARLDGLGIHFLDAPVSGGTSGAEQGTLTIMVGGDAAIMETVRPVLEAVGKTIVYCGPVGAGDAVKAVNNALLAVNLWSTVEGLVTLAKAGVPPAVALGVINASSGRSNASMTLIPDRVLTRAFPRTFRLALLDKDVGIAASVAREHRVVSPVLQEIAELLRLARAELGEDADHAELAKVIERWAGIELV